MLIKMLTTITGTCDGQDTRLGAVVDIGEASAKEYIERRWAEACAPDDVEPEPEPGQDEDAEPEPDEAPVVTTTEAPRPARNAARQTGKTAPRG